MRTKELTQEQLARRSDNETVLVIMAFIVGCVATVLLGG